MCDSEKIRAELHCLIGSILDDNKSRRHWLWFFCGALSVLVLALPMASVNPPLNDVLNGPYNQVSMEGIPDIEIIYQPSFLSQTM